LFFFVYLGKISDKFFPELPIHFFMTLSGPRLRGVDDRMIYEEEIVVRFEVFTAVTMKNGVFWVVTPCGHKA
jgi:hypothetical protein